MTAPTDYANLQVWYDASQESYANNDTVTVVTDRSGNGRNTSAAAGSPVFNTGVFPLGGSAFNFDGTNDSYTMPGTPDTYIDSGALTFFAVFILDVVETNNATLYLNDCLIGSDSGLALGAFRSTGPTITAGSDGVTLDPKATIATATPYVVMIRQSSTTGYLSLNGGSETSATVTPAVTGGVTTLGRSLNSKYFDGKLAELFIYSAVRSAGEVTALITYLNEKWITAAPTFTGYPRPQQAVYRM